MSTGTALLAEGNGSAEQPSVGGDDRHLAGNGFPAGKEGTLHRVFQPAAAGNLHPGHGDAFDVIRGEDLCQLFRIVRLIQLRTADQCDTAADEILMKAAVSISCAVCRNQQVSSVKEGCIDGNKLICTGHWPRQLAFGTAAGSGLFRATTLTAAPGQPAWTAFFFAASTAASL